MTAKTESVFRRLHEFAKLVESMALNPMFLSHLAKARQAMAGQEDCNKLE
jgi:hypothetical protein